MKAAIDDMQMSDQEGCIPIKFCSQKLAEVGFGPRAIVGRKFKSEHQNFDSQMSMWIFNSGDIFYYHYGFLK